MTACWYAVRNIALASVRVFLITACRVSALDDPGVASRYRQEEECRNCRYNVLHSLV